MLYLRIFILLLSLLSKSAHGHFLSKLLMNVSSEFFERIPENGTWSIQMFSKDIVPQSQFSTTQKIEIQLGYITGSSRKSGNLKYSRPGLTISGGLTYALHNLKQQGFFSQTNILGSENLTNKEFSQFLVSFNLIVRETFGDEDESLKQVATLWKDHNVSVIIGPQETCLHEGKLASSLNIPMISYFCSDEETSDKNIFTTFSRTRPPDAAISRAIASLILKYDWRTALTLIYSDSGDDPRFKRGAKSLSVLLEQKKVKLGKIIPYAGPYHHGYGDNPFEAIVENTMKTTRIYIIISEYYEHLGMLLALKKFGVLETGEYLVIGVSMDDYKEEEWNPQRYFRGLLHDETEAGVPDAFRSYLGIVASPPRNFTEFSKTVNNFMELSPFNWPNPLARVGGWKKIRIEAAYLYDAITLYATALRNVLRDAILKNENPYDKILDGQEIARKLRKINFQSATGHKSEMDENGDAMGNFTLITLKHKNEIFGLWPTGYFIQDETSDLPVLALNESIDWVGGNPPVSEPKCGFFLEKCHSDNTSIIVMGIILVIVLFLSAGFYLAFRHWRLSRDIDNLLWKIDKRDIEWETSNLFPASRTNSKPNSGGSMKPFGVVTTSTSSGSLNRFTNLFSPLVTYRGRIFAAKKLELDISRVLTLDSSLKRQLKMLREIRHENLNAFIGACQYDDGLLLLSEYCSRGSIKDILENCDLKLDDMFVSSLVGDLLRGLSYLHDSSAFRFHGNLKPSNCLVDSRWVLKLSDFGLIYHNSYSSKKYQNNSTDSFSGIPLEARANLNPLPNEQNKFINTNPSRPSLRVRYSFTNTTNPKNYFGDNSSPNSHGSNNATSALIPKTFQTPYLPPEFSSICNRASKQGPNNCIDEFRKSDIYSLGVVLWELLKRESLSSYLRLKSDSEVQEAILAETNDHSKEDFPKFWAKALGSLLPPSLIYDDKHKNVRTQHSTPASRINNKALNNLNISSLSYNSPEGSTEHINMCVIGTNRSENLNAKKIESNSLITIQVVEVLESCLQFDPEHRPDLRLLRTKLRPLHKGMKSNIFDTMIGLMEKYANNLEKLVDERTKQLSEEKRKTDILLYELIPATVADELKKGLRVPAQNYECVSIYFSDIVGFTSMSAQSTALQVVEFLNDLYTCFDSIIENFDVYKVETIGDAYMVASGLPVKPTGNSHALEMARMTLTILQSVNSFKIRHRPSEQLKVRIGLHSGPVAAGVVGQKRPRYCLFGDTVNTASRMESTGLPHRIHCSQAFFDLTQENFVFEERGVVDVKGKGDMTTYWLVKEK